MVLRSVPEACDLPMTMRVAVWLGSAVLRRRVVEWYARHRDAAMPQVEGITRWAFLRMAVCSDVSSDASEAQQDVEALRALRRTLLDRQWGELADVHGLACVVGCNVAVYHVVTGKAARGGRRLELLHDIGCGRKACDNTLHVLLQHGHYSLLLPEGERKQRDELNRGLQAAWGRQAREPKDLWTSDATG